MANDVIDLVAELRGLVRIFDEESIDYALCGGMAMAVHGFPRATVDIDLLIRPEDYERARGASAKAGFDFETRPMSFDGGKMEIRRVTKIVGSEVLILDFLLVAPSLEDVWADRRLYELSDGPIRAVSRQGLIKLKQGRASKQDQADIERLLESE